MVKTPNKGQSPVHATPTGTEWFSSGEKRGEGR